MTIISGTDQARVEEAWEAFGREAIATEQNAQQAAIDAFIKAGPGALYIATYQIFQCLGVELQKHSIGYVIEPAHPNFDRQQWSSPKITISGIKHLPLTVDAERRHVSKWRSETTGRFRIVWGDYGNKKSFPQRKGGDHNYEEVVHLIRGKIAAEKATATAKSTAASNRDTTNILRNDLGLGEFGCLKLAPSSTEEGKINVKLDMGLSMDAEGVRKLVAALREVGALTPYQAVEWRVIAHRSRDDDEQWIDDGWQVVRGGSKWSTWPDESWEIGQLFMGADEETKERAQRHADDLNRTLVEPLTLRAMFDDPRVG